MNTLQFYSLLSASQVLSSHHYNEAGSILMENETKAQKVPSNLPQDTGYPGQAHGKSGSGVSEPACYAASERRVGRLSHRKVPVDMEREPHCRGRPLCQCCAQASSLSLPCGWGDVPAISAITTALEARDRTRAELPEGSTSCVTLSEY